MAEPSFDHRFSGETRRLVPDHRPPTLPLTLDLSPKKPAWIANRSGTLFAPTFRGRGNKKTASSKTCRHPCPEGGWLKDGPNRNTTPFLGKGRSRGTRLRGGPLMRMRKR